MIDHQAKTRVPSAAANGKKGYTLISDAKFRQLYELTVLLQPAARAASGLGAVLAGVMADLRSGDGLIGPGLNDGQLDEGRASEPLRSRLPLAMRSPGTTTMADLIVESVSASTVDRLRRNERVTVIFAPATGADPVLTEARALASAGRLPVLFVEDGRKKTVAQPANGDAMPSIPVDSSDVIAIYRVAHESITRARQGSGPTQIVCTRWQPAGGKGDDATQRLEQWLITRGLPVEEWRAKITAEMRTADGSRPSKTAPGADEEAGPSDAQRFAQAHIE